MQMLNFSVLNVFPMLVFHYISTLIIIVFTLNVSYSQTCVSASFLVNDKILTKTFVPVFLKGKGI